MPDAAVEEAEATSLALVLEVDSEELTDSMREDRDASGEVTPLIVVDSAAHGLPSRAVP